MNNIFIVFLAIAAATVSSNPLGDLKARQAKIATALGAVAPPASLAAHRRLVAEHGEEHANKLKTSFKDVVDERSYHIKYAKQISTLRQLGFAAEELPQVEAHGLTSEFSSSNKKMHEMIMNVKKALKAAKKKAATTTTTASNTNTDTTDTTATTETTDTTSDKPSGPRYLREISPGIHEVAIDGGGSLPEHHRNELDRKLAGTAGDISNSKLLGTCTEVSNGHVYDAYTSSTLWGMDADGTNHCTCETIKEAGTETIATTISSAEIKFPARYCACKENAKMFSFTTYKCTKYPALAPSSKCTIDTTSFPKTIRCDYVLVIGTDAFQSTTTLSTQFSVGYGATGKKTDLVAELSAGLYTSPMPTPCPIVEMTTLGFPDVAAEMFGKSVENIEMVFCNMLHYIATKAAKLDDSMDMGQTVFGKAGGKDEALFMFLCFLKSYLLN